MTTLVNENCLSLFQYFCVKIFKSGRIPQHVAIIMDGNRRFAKKYHYSDSVAGHHKGFEKLSEVVRIYLNGPLKFYCGLQWCVVLGVPEVTVYAFSIENFKRKTNEVNSIMDLTREKFERLLNEIDAVNRMGIQVYVTGRLSLLSEELQRLISKVMLATKNNKKLRLNIAYAYTGRDEISRAASHIMEGVEKNELTADAIDENLISQTLDIGEPDLLIRTSGEVRLSDFMLWQVSNTVLYFSDVLWPEFTIWNFLQAIIHFQRHASLKPQARANTDRQREFLDNLEKKRWEDSVKNIC